MSFFLSLLLPTVAMPLLKPWPQCHWSARLTIRSRRCRFAARLNSSVRRGAAAVAVRPLLPVTVLPPSPALIPSHTWHRSGAVRPPGFCRTRMRSQLTASGKSPACATRSLAFRLRAAAPRGSGGKSPPPIIAGLRLVTTGSLALVRSLHAALPPGTVRA